MRPQLTLEQAVESGSPASLDVVEAHRRGTATAHTLFFFSFAGF
jgi:hypothetical protein